MDWELVARLLDVTDGARGLPKLKNLYQAAMAELERLDGEAVSSDKPSTYPYTGDAERRA